MHAAQARLPLVAQDNMQAVEEGQGLDEGLWPFLAGRFPGQPKLRVSIARNVYFAARELIKELKKINDYGEGYVIKFTEQIESLIAKMNLRLVEEKDLSN